MLTISDIVRDLKDKPLSDVESDDDQAKEDNIPPQTTTEALSALQTINSYMQSHDTPFDLFENLYSFERFTRQCAVSERKQATIFDFFAKSK